MVFFFSHSIKAEELMLEKFDIQPEKRWEFFSDQVMGGVSTGKISFNKENKLNFINLTGIVSTQNNGGFIQARIKLAEPLTKNIKGIVINAKGNNTTYYLHIRTAGTILPWQYYQISFEVKEEYKEYILQIKEFKKSGSFQPSMVNSKSISSVAVVAYGRDHKADIHVKEISFHE